MILILHADPIPPRLDESGTVRMGASRVTLDILVQRFNQGDSPETLAQSFSTLSLAGIYTALGYYLLTRPHWGDRSGDSSHDGTPGQANAQSTLLAVQPHESVYTEDIVKT
jgi:hypothetical protein